MDLARRTEGVAEVLDRIQVTPDVSSRLGPAWAQLRTTLDTALDLLDATALVSAVLGTPVWLLIRVHRLS